MELQSLDALLKINIEVPSKLTKTELEESIVLWGAKILLRFEETTNMNLNFLPKSIYQSRLSQVTIDILVLRLAQKCLIYCDRLSLFFIIVLLVTL
ncbi:hypothetical protein GOP47_0023390 [Adiantum capillus-veneris]|uniref:Uncharacterized protein n=1 Tax=Adiantum capillus-veneris TaxID=13818 RepID=A0A9D4U4E3_ADICA|nr:hypothetical protein GOP47_0023390 [Adiantum capillus-veneris]